MERSFLFDVADGWTRKRVAPKIRTFRFFLDLRCSHMRKEPLADVRCSVKRHLRFSIPEAFYEPNFIL